MAQRVIKNNTKSQTNTVWLLDFIERYWYVVIGVIFVYPIIKRYIDSQHSKNAENDAENNAKLTKVIASNPVTLQKALNEITIRSEVHDIARNVAYHLGTDIYTADASIWDYLNPRGMTENDKDAYLELARIKQAGTVDLVVRCYYLLTRRDLRADVKKLLDPEYLNKLPFFK